MSRTNQLTQEDISNLYGPAKFATTSTEYAKAVNKVRIFLIDKQIQREIDQYDLSKYDPGVS